MNEAANAKYDLIQCFFFTKLAFPFLILKGNESWGNKILDSNISKEKSCNAAQGDISIWIRKGSIVLQCDSQKTFKVCQCEMCMFPTHCTAAASESWKPKFIQQQNLPSLLTMQGNLMVDPSFTSIFWPVVTKLGRVWMTCSPPCIDSPFEAVAASS